MNMENYGITANMKENEWTPGRITAVHRERFEVICEQGTFNARLKAAEYYAGMETFPTVGDFVQLNLIENGDSQIIATLPRRSFFSRRDPDKGRGEQAVAANFDYVFLMQSLNLDFNPKRLERYLTVAWQSGAVPVILLTKADLVQDATAQVLEAERVAPGVAIHTISAHTGEGLPALEQYLQPGKTVVFLGSSGVGKSSLVNRLAGAEVMTVNGIREDDSKGRHTTTHRQLLMLPSGTVVIDTPGMRELGMWDVSEGIGSAFADVEQYLGRCRFNDCQHNREPGCAIRAAIESGELDAARWESYLTLQQEAESKESIQRRKKEFMKNIAKTNRQRKKDRW